MRVISLWYTVFSEAPLHALFDMVCLLIATPHHPQVIWDPQQQMNPSPSSNKLENDLEAPVESLRHQTDKAATHCTTNAHMCVSPLTSVCISFVCVYPALLITKATGTLVSTPTNPRRREKGRDQYEYM